MMEAQTPADVLTVGVGLAGASAARALADAGRRVVALDKGRGPGGRLSTRRVEGGGIDHGAALLQASSVEFKAWLEAKARKGLAARWGVGWVGVPGMNALVAGLLKGIDVAWSTTVASLCREDGLWRAYSVDGVLLAEASALVLAIPAPQARALLANVGDAGSAHLAEALGEVVYAPCWAGLIAIDSGHVADSLTSPAPSSGLLASLGLETLLREADKPGRVDGGHWMVHATAAWSQQHLELPADEAAARLREAFVHATGIDAAAIRSCTAHRWRYARPLSGIEPAAADGLAGIALAGDAVGWTPADALAPAERAWRSGLEAAARVLAAAPLQPKS